MSAPLVSGVSPREGLPGTKITIRGENLGLRKEDVSSIVICGSSCMDRLEYVSSKKLVCYTPNVVGPGEIIIATYSGGIGKSTVTFIGLEPARESLLDPLQESDVWKEEEFNFLSRFSVTRAAPIYTRDLTDPVGQTAGVSRKIRAGSENLGELYPNSSASLMDENFHPVRHLLEKHRHTTFDDLKLGLHRLQREVEKNDQAPIDFMRDNLDAFLQCYDTLSDVNSALIRDESDSQGGTLTDRVEELLGESATRARKVFDGILKSKMRADTTRNALSVLQRYRFLFSLPKNIEKNIKNHEYDLVATDYEKAKSLFSNTQVHIFKRVLEEVEKQIANFREDLRHQLLVLPLTLDQQKKLIKYLLELDCDGDPAWDCISNMFLWMLRLLYTSKEDLQSPLQCPNRAPGELAALPDIMGPVYEPLPPVLPPRARTGTGKDGHSRNVSDVSFVSNSSYGSQSTAATSPSAVKSPERHKICGAGGVPVLKGIGWGARMGDASSPPNRICFVEEVTEVFCVTLPDLWKLGQAYLNGRLFQGVALLTENQQKLALRCDSSKGKFESKVVEVIDIYTNMVNCALFPDAYESLSDTMTQKLGEWKAFDDDTLEASGVWLPQTVRRIRECVSSMEGLGLPEKGVSMLRSLAMNVRSLCADTLFQRAAKDIKVLHEREDWKVHNEEGGIVTSLPVLFENRVVDVLLTLKEIVNEAQEEMLPQLHQELRDTAKKHFAVLLDHFLASIDCLAFHSEDDETVGSDQSLGDQQLQHPVPAAAKTCKDRHLLILLSNMHYMMAEVVPRVFTCFLSQGYSSSIDLQDQMIEEVVILDNKIFKAYINRKSDSLQGIIEHGMTVGYFSWEHAGNPTHVRTYVREILMNLVLIHAEVYAVSAHIVPRVMHELVNILSKEFLECICEVEAFNVNGIIHGFVELAALKDILEPFLDAESRKNFEESKQHLGAWDIEGNERIAQVVEEFKINTRLQLKCFQVLADTDSEIEILKE